MEKRQDDEGKKFFNYQAGHWDNYFKSGEDLRKINQLITKCKFSEHEVLLEAGCGSGCVTEYLSRKISQGSIVSVDYSEEMIKKAKGKHYILNVKFILGELLEISFPKEHFSSILCFNSFPHFNKKQGILSSFYDWLKEQGKLYIVHSMSRKQVNMLHGNFKESISKDILPHPNQINILLHYNGFEPVEVVDGDDYFYMEYKKPIRKPFVY